MTQASQQPFPLANDLPESGVVFNEPQQVPPPPAWFAYWEATTFRPFRDSVQAKLKVLQLVKYAGVGIGTVLVTKWPELGKLIQPIITGLLGGG